MKKIFLAVCLLCSLSVFVSAKENEKQQFRVNAEAEVKVTPDRASMTFGVYYKDADLKKGRSQMQKVIADALAFCRKNGVQEKNLKTDYISVSPRYSNKFSKSSGYDKEVLEYDLTQTFTVVLEDVSKYDTILYGLLELGINKVENIAFYSSQVRKYRDEARLLAVKAAKEKATLLSNAAGVKLGKVINLSEDSVYTPYYGRNNFANASQNMTQYEGGYEGEGFSAGQTAIKASVSLVYEID